MASGNPANYGNVIKVFKSKGINIPTNTNQKQEFMHDGSFCPCCGMMLRVSPVNKRDRNRLREIHVLE